MSGDLSLADALLRNGIFSDYKQSDVDMASTTRYYGFLKLGGEWYIMREIQTGAAMSYRYCKGSSDYTTAWTNRAGQNYDYYDTIFK